MQISIPIKQLVKVTSSIEPLHRAGQSDIDSWDRKHDLGAYSALDFWARHEYYVDIHHPERHVDIPRAVQLGHGDMHLNKWFAPEELITGARKPTFKVKLNVSGFRLEELKVKLSEEERLLTIEGQHHEHYEQHQSKDHQLRARRNSVHTNFKRSVTLPVQVLESKLECSLTADGSHLVLTAPVKTLPPLSPASARRRCQEGGKCANLTKCECEFDAEDKRG